MFWPLHFLMSQQVLNLSMQKAEVTYQKLIERVVQNIAIEKQIIKKMKD